MMGVIKNRPKLAAGVTVVVWSTPKSAVGKRTKPREGLRLLFYPSFVTCSILIRGKFIFCEGLKLLQHAKLSNPSRGINISA